MVDLEPSPKSKCQVLLTLLTLAGSEQVDLETLELLIRNGYVRFELPFQFTVTAQGHQYIREHTNGTA